MTFPKALEDAMMESGEAFQKVLMHYFSNKESQAGFQRLMYDLLMAVVNNRKSKQQRL